MSYGTVMLDDFMPGDDGSGNTLMDSIQNTDPDLTVEWYTQTSMRQELKRVLDKLTDRERKITIHTYGLFGESQLTNGELAKLFKVTAERVRQIQSSVIMKIRANGPAILEEYV